jgi:hypothetical protein
LFTRPPTFRNALVQSIAGGNTMVFNRAAHQLLVQAGAVDVVCHDWWTYLVVTACGGVVRYDSIPALKYRQHGGNQIGSPPRWIPRLRRMPTLLTGQWRNWNKQNVRALSRLEHMLHPDNQRVLKKFIKIQESRLLSRLSNLRASGIYRQTTLGDLSLLAATFLRKL